MRTRWVLRAADLEAVVRQRSEWLDIDTDGVNPLLDALLQGYTRAFIELTCVSSFRRRRFLCGLRERTELLSVSCYERVESTTCGEPPHRPIGRIALDDVAQFDGVALGALMHRLA